MSIGNSQCITSGIFIRAGMRCGPTDLGAATNVVSWWVLDMSETIENPDVHISAHAKAILRELALHEGKPMEAVLDEAIEHYQRERLLDEANAAYARLKGDPEAWKEELAEREQWDCTLSDGLEKK